MDNSFSVYENLELVSCMRCLLRLTELVSPFSRSLFELTESLTRMHSKKRKTERDDREENLQSWRKSGTHVVEEDGEFVGKAGREIKK